MPSNVFANTGTNVSVLFFDKSHTSDKVVLIDASKLGEDYQEDGLKKHRITEPEIDHIVDIFRNKKEEEDFSVAISYDDIKEKGYSLSAGQYIDVKIDYVDITESEFTERMLSYREKLLSYFSKSRELEEKMIFQLDNLLYETN